MSSRKQMFLYNNSFTDICISSWIDAKWRDKSAPIPLIESFIRISHEDGVSPFRTLTRNSEPI